MNHFVKSSLILCGCCVLLACNESEPAPAAPAPVAAPAPAAPAAPAKPALDPNVEMPRAKAAFEAAQKAAAAKDAEAFKAHVTDPEGLEFTMGVVARLEGAELAWMGDAVLYKKTIEDDGKQSTIAGRMVLADGNWRLDTRGGGGAPAAPTAGEAKPAEADEAPAAEDEGDAPEDAPAEAADDAPADDDEAEAADDEGDDPAE